jgi:ABC-2 type transport system permease protein
VFIFAIVTALAVPCHLYFLGEEHPEAQYALTHGSFRFWRIGIKAFQRMEL